MKAIYQLCIASLAVVLTACTAVTDEAFYALEYALAANEDVVLSEQELREFPYTAIYVNQEGSPQALVVLGYVDGRGDKANFTWVSADNELLVTRRGRVVRTLDLHNNLVATSDLASDPLRCIVTRPDDCLRTWQRQLDFETDGKQISRQLSSTFSVQGTTTLQLPLGETEVTHVRENVEVALSGKSFVNEFWIEADGHVVKSRQHILMDEPAFNLTQAKWVGR